MEQFEQILEQHKLLFGVCTSFLAALFSGVITQIVLVVWQKVREGKKRKYEIFSALMGGRYVLFSEEMVKSLNMIDVVFYGDIAVRTAYKNFIGESNKPESGDDGLMDAFVKMLEEMSKVLSLKDIKWDDIKRCYYPTQLAEIHDLKRVALKNQTRKK